MTSFKHLADAVNVRWSNMSKGELYTVGSHEHKDLLWKTYLNSFPEGSNPLFRERSEHDCNTCKQFVRGFGNVVQISSDYNIYSIWESLELHASIYTVVADAMRDFIISLPLTGLFRTAESGYGTEKTHALIDGVAETFNHFHAKTANRHLSRQAGAEVGNFNSSVQVFERGLIELNTQALSTVIDLIDNGSLYRGEEHLRTINEFRTLQRSYVQVENKQAFVFANAGNPAARFRNTVIGTLVDDLSSGVDLERAVRSFESKVAPTNYKRPKALITPAMVSSAMKTINELGIEDSLMRRHAVISDVSVNNVLWVNNDVQSKMKDGLEGILMSAASSSKFSLSKNAKPEEISIVSFMKDVLPSARNIELMVKNSHEGNFVNLTTGVNTNSPNVFKWDNNFAWSYGGNVTDSIKEKVKRAGGNVTGQLRVSLSWFNTDDLDIHVHEPNGIHISYMNKRGKLDVDMNAGSVVRDPVENVTWGKNTSIQDGEYKIVVNQYQRRESVDVGFVIETESNGIIEQYHYDKPVRGSVSVGSLIVKDRVIADFKLGKGIQGGSVSKDVWGIKTEQFTTVETIMYSPNHWDNLAVGNKHYIFTLKDCRNPNHVRGIYGEFLKGDLHEKHGKVFEMVSAKTQIQPSDQQLAGVGFSSTTRTSVVARVNVGNKTRLFEIQF